MQQLLLLLFLMQNSPGRRPGGDISPFGESFPRHQRSGNLPAFRLPDTTYMISNLRQTLDTVERMSRMVDSLRSLPAALGNMTQSLPMLESPSSGEYEAPHSKPDLNQLMQSLGPILNTLGNSENNE